MFPVFWSSVILVQSYLVFVSLEGICYFVAWINIKSVKECGPFYYMLVVPEFNFKMKYLILLSIQNLLDFLWLFLNAFWFAIHLSQRHLVNNHASPDHVLEVCFVTCCTSSLFMDCLSCATFFFLNQYQKELINFTS